MHSLLIPALLVPLTLSLVRIHSHQLLASFRQWRRVLVASIWMLLVSPLLVWLVLHLTTLPEPIAMATLITAAAPPVTVCAAIALFLQPDAAIVVVLTVVTMLLVPLTLPSMVLYLVGLKIDVELWQISLRLAGFIFGAFTLAFFVKKIFGQRWLDRYSSAMDGISVIFITVFIIGVMQGVTDHFIQHPWFVKWLCFRENRLPVESFLASLLKDLRSKVVPIFIFLCL